MIKRNCACRCFYRAVIVFYQLPGNFIIFLVYFYNCNGQHRFLMDQKVVCMFFLMLGISHGLECYHGELAIGEHFNATTFTKETCENNDDVCMKRTYCCIIKNLLVNYNVLKIHNFDCRRRRRGWISWMPTISGAQEKY